MKRLFFTLALLCATVGAMAQTDETTVSARRARRDYTDDNYYQRYTREQRDSVRAARRALRLSAKQVAERVQEAEGFKHTYNAGLLLTKAERVGFASMGTMAAGAVLTTIGAVKDKDALMYVGLGLDGVSLVMAAYAMHFRLQGGKELMLGAGCIQYNF